VRVPLCRLDEIPADGAKSVEFFGREVLVMRIQEHPRAIMNVCMHLGGPLHREGERLVCAWHGAEFSCANGRHLAGPGREDARLLTLPVVVEDGMVTYVYGERAEPGVAAAG
jgi:nitrite reductase/ring-hydroxylating ferredoxin subunit